LKKDCGEPGCRNDHRSQVLSRGDELNNGVTSAVGTYGTCRATLTMSVVRGKVDLALGRIEV